MPLIFGVINIFCRQNKLCYVLDDKQTTQDHHLQPFQLQNKPTKAVFSLCRGIDNGALLVTIPPAKTTIGNDTNLGVNYSNYPYPLPLVFWVEVLASALRMAVIPVVANKRGLRGFGGMVIGGMMGISIYISSPFN